MGRDDHGVHLHDAYVSMTMPMSLITPPRVVVHSAVMVYMTRSVRANKLTIPAFAMWHPHTVITILVTTM